MHLTSYHSGQEPHEDRISATAKALSACGSSMAATTLISCGAMLPFVFSEFVPTQQFAIIIIAMLSLAWLGDVVLLPVILLLKRPRNQIKAN